MKKITMIIDTAMVLILPLLMAYSLLNDKYHEYLGIAAAVSFVTHHVINRRWWRTLFKGKYTPPRILNTAVNLLLTVYMILQPLSGITLSKYVLKRFSFGNTLFFRNLHMALAYWGFILMSFHLGLHIDSLKAKLHPKKNEVADDRLCVNRHLWNLCLLCKKLF